MTLIVSQPCLEFTELGLNSMAAASALWNFCFQQKHVSVQVPTLDEGDPPEGMGSSWQPALPGLSPSRPACSPLGWGHTRSTDF